MSQHVSSVGVAFQYLLVAEHAVVVAEVPLQITLLETLDNHQV